MGDGLEFGLIANEVRRQRGKRLNKKAQRLYKHMARTDGAVREGVPTSSGYEAVKESTGRKVAKGFVFAGFWDLFS
jgi:hypothetical protein